MTEQFVPHGKHFIAGEWLSSDQKLISSPASGSAFEYSVGSATEVNAACEAAEAAFASFGYSSRESRARFLNTIADEIEARAEQITEIGHSETGLPVARMQGERGRTVGQLRLFAEHILAGDYLDRRHDEALPDRAPLPRPDLRLIQRPIGPVAVFGASNFPLAFSTAGGDTAAAFAAGCPVVVKGHPAHPGTGEIMAEAIAAAVKKCDLHPGVFAFIQSGSREAGEALVKHPLINAVGFTGSLAGGKALFDLCMARPTPIPFFGELGSVNPMFILPSATANRGEEIGSAWAASLTMGAGQFCTKPGIAIIEEGTAGDAIVDAAKVALQAVAAQTMLTDGIANAYRTGVDSVASNDGVTALLAADTSARSAMPSLYETSADNWLAKHSLSEEVFGPMGLVVRVSSADQMLTIAKALEGQLTATIQMDETDEDIAVAASLLPVLERKAGRLLVNGFPTGVEVSDTMVHGGPFPASTNFGATSVGTMAIRRFLRPVCYQNIPAAILPADLV